MRYRPDWDIPGTEYPVTRSVLSAEGSDLDDNELEDVLAEMFPGAAPDEVEDFLGSIAKIGSKVAPLAQKALPGIIQGAVTGGTVAGPYGALIGAVGGGAASLLGGGGAPAAPRPGPAPAPTPAPVATPTPTPPVPPPPQAAAEPTPSPPGTATAPSPAPTAPAPQPSTANPAAAQLLSLLSRPETQQALMALLMADKGRPTVQVGARNVPAEAFATAISEYAADAAQSVYRPLGSGLAEHLTDDTGGARCDVANPRERAAVLAADLSAIAAAEAEGESDDYGEEWSEEIETIDPLASYQAALTGRRVYA
jgi:hypothetical protein